MRCKIPLCLLTTMEIRLKSSRIGSFSELKAMSDDMIFNCRGCEYSYVSPLYLKRHRCRHIQEEATAVKCPTCNCAFIYTQNFERHKKFCKKLQQSPKEILGEISNKLEDKQRVPSVVPKVPEQTKGISDPQTPAEGKSSATDQKKTDKTENRFQNEPYVKIMRVAWFSKRSPAETQKVLEENLAELFICHECTDHFPDKLSLRTHFEIHTRETVYLCPHCDIFFLKRSSLSNHVLSHERDKNFVCKECNAQLCDKRSLQRHLRVHSGERPFVCAKCNSRFTDSGNLHKHLRIHSGEKPFACEYCPKTFLERKMLTRHVRVHTGEKPHSCPECFEKFASKLNLAKHLQIHNGEKPYVCIECREKFYSSKALKKHLRIHDDDKHISEPPCDAQFPAKFEKTLSFTEF